MSVNAELKVYDGSWGESIKEAISKNYIKHYEYENFRNVQEISSGSLGKVYKANWKNGIHKYFTLKSLNNVIERVILHEFKLQREMDFHDNVHLYGITTPNRDMKNDYMLVMEYMEDTFQDYLRKNFNNITWNSRIQIALRLAHAVTRLHDERIPHCNLHPDGLFVLHDTIKFADFELSRRSNEACIGIIPYVDPKILRGKRKESKDAEHSLNEKNDVYTMGVFLWELSSGRPPFNTDGKPYDIGLAMDILQGLREKPIPNTPNDYVQLYTECWDNDHDKRPSMNEVVRRLEAIASQMTNETFIQPINNFNNVINHDQSFNNNNMDNDISLENVTIKMIIDLIFNLTNEGDKHEVDIKDDVIDYINKSKTNLPKILSWIINNPNNTNSTFILGYFYLHGIGIKLDRQKAFNSFSISAERNNLFAQYFMGLCYEFGFGTEQDVTMAFKFYEKIAKENYAPGEVRVGYFYNEGICVKKDTRSAIYWYEKAASHGSMVALLNIAKMYYRNGEGVVQDGNKAFEIFNQMANKNHSKGILMLANCYHFGVGTKTDRVKSIELYVQAAELGNSIAQFNLAAVYEDRFEFKDAIYWYRRSSQLGHEGSLKRISELEELVNKELMKKMNEK